MNAVDGMLENGVLENGMLETHETADIVGLVSDLITRHGLEPGDRLPPIRELAVQFGVKAGAVRDALLAAQVKGVVKVLPRVGAVVQFSSHLPATQSDAAKLLQSFGNAVGQPDQNLFHVLETRETLELTMVARAAQRRELPELFRLRQILTEMAAIPVEMKSPEYTALDVQFHLEIGRLSGNSLMTSLLDVLLQALKPNLERIRWSDNRRTETHVSHARIYSALVAGDVEQAQSEMRDHIRTAYDSLLDEMRQPPTIKVS